MLQQKFAGPLAQVDLVFAFLGSLYDLSAREKGAALGGSAEEIPALNPRRVRVATGSAPKNAMQKLHQISNGFWTPKCSQKPPKMNPTCNRNPLLFRLRFHPVVYHIFGCFLACFDRRPTLDLIGIYNKFVGCSIFRKAWKSNQNDLQQ